MTEAEAARQTNAEEPAYQRREPTMGNTPPPEQEERPAAVAREMPLDNDPRLLGGYEIRLARGENRINDIEWADASGLNRLILTDRRLILWGRDHQTTYPLRGISRLAVVKYLRWWLVLAGAALGGAGALGALMPALLFPLPHVEWIYVWGALFLAGLALMAVGLLRPVEYLEIRTLAGDLKMPLKRDREGVADFVSCLGERIR